jgi:serine/threonine protein kinase/tetratricopeptide (TPR) repeat protein
VPLTDPAEPLRTALAGRYRIERELGQGGMATVYLAHDLKHHRDVALKVLKPEIGQALGAERFLREIQLAAKLNHPHILPLYDSGEAGGFLYFVMPAMQGQTLRERLQQEGQLPVDSVVRIASEVADALDYAHRHDVVHRDIKPENILLHEGHAVVADFGIGKAIVAAASEATTFTQVGVTVGTPAYMSPEQAAGETLDGRSDLFALGCVLYEMLTGEPAFTGNTVQALISSRFVHTPPEVTARRPAIPAAVSQTVARLLTREPADRPATGAQVITSLTSAPVAPTPRPGDDTSIAVLPFASLSRDADDEFFADGVTEEILNALAQIPRLRVAGRSSAFSFKGKNEDLRTVGTKLNVATILEGTIRRAGPRLRVTAQLSKASDGYQMWSERYDRVAEDVFAVQDEIAAAIAGRLRLSLAGDAGARASRPPTENLEAYQLYLKGRALLYQRGKSIPKALICFEQAVALDPNYAQAWAGMADAYTTSGYSGFVPGARVMPNALDAARRALGLDPDLAEAHNALACAALTWERDYALAEREFQRALELNPNYVQAGAWYGLFYLLWTAGRAEEAYEVLLRTVQNDPLSGYAQVILAFAETVTGRHADAIAHGRRGVELDPDSYLANWSLMEALIHAGEYAEAVSLAERVLAMSGNHLWGYCGLTHAYGAWGKLDEARRHFAEAEAREARDYLQPCMMAYAAEAAGEREKAIAYADRAERERDPLFVLLARLWPEYAPLRTDPRFHAIVARLRLPDYYPPEATG